ncbi:hypothetical protein ACS0TY_026275 [Phlomoides rotata]
MLTSSRDDWERLVAAVLKKQQIWELCHQQSRSPSISTITSDDLSEQILSFSSTNSELFSASVPEIPSVSQVKNNASSRPIKRKLFSPWYGRRKSKDKDLVDIPEYATIHFPHLRKFSLNELQIATKAFSTTCLIARGVYSCRLDDGSPVVVKRKQTVPNSSCRDSILRELEISSIAAHPNVLRALGYCITPNEQLVVYPLMVNGSVKSWLRDRGESKAPLDWLIKKGIALGAARGLAYLQEEICDQNIIHRDIKAANILLDKDFQAVLADFGLGIIVKHSTTFVEQSIYGTFGYIAPEYIEKGEFSEKIDVFGYGVFLLEIITGQRAYDPDRIANGEDGMLLYWVKRIVKKGYWEKIVDADCDGIIQAEDVVKLLLQVALLCTRSDPKGRPKMSEVVRMFEDGNGLAERWEEWIKNVTDEVQEPPVWNDYQSTNWIIDDSSTLVAEELSGPR